MRKVEKTLLQNQQNNKVTNFNKKKKKRTISQKENKTVQNDIVIETGFTLSPFLENISPSSWSSSTSAPCCDCKGKINNLVVSSYAFAMKKSLNLFRNLIK